MFILQLALSGQATGRYERAAAEEQEPSWYLQKAREYFFNDYDQAYRYALKGLELADPAADAMDRIRLLQITAEIEYFYLNKFFKSINHLNEMRALCDSIGFAQGIPWYNLNLANIYYYQNYFNRALELYEEALSGASAFGDTVMYINALTGKADILRRRNEYDSAIVLINRGLDYAGKAGRKDMQLFLYDDLADIYKRREMADSSLWYYQQTYKIAGEVSSDYWIIVSRINLAYMRYVRDHSYDPVPELRSLQQEARQLRFIRQYIDIGNTLTEVYADRKEYHQAYEQMMRVNAVKDSIDGIEGISKIAELESQYYLQKAQLENLELLRENERTSYQLRIRKTIIWFTLFALSQAIILIYLLLRKYRQVRDNLQTIQEQEQKLFDQERVFILREKEMMEQALMAQKRELAGNLMRIYHNDQLLRKLSEDLGAMKEQLQAGDGVDGGMAVQGLQSLMNQISLASGEPIWSEFEKQFVEVHPGFLERLSTRHPDLTTNETRLCVFLFLNLRTKEISSITRQSIKSINVARTRLRKKLELSNSSASIHSYLEQI